ncbi:MAG: BMP family protein [Aggregatilineales bacterium]
MTKRAVFTIFVALLVLSLSAVAVAQDGPVKVAIVLPSSTTDIAWSQSIYSALLTVQEQMGGPSAMEIAYSEGMFDVTAAAQALRDYAEDGYHLVIAHGTQYGTSLFDLAPDFPETSFAWGTASDTGIDRGINNVFAYEASSQEGGYVNGVMAGLLTRSNVIGIVGPVPAGDALLYINGFQQGVYASNPDAQILLAYTGSFGDTAGAAELAQTQIAAGADILTGSAQQVVGAIDAIQSAGGYWFGTQSDQSTGWPTTVVASQVFNWVPVITDMLAKRAEGVLGGIAYDLTLSDNTLTFAFGDIEIPDDVLSAAEQAINDIISGVVYPLGSLPETTFRVALVLPSSISDLAWSQSIYDGLVGLQRQLGGPSRLEIAYSEGMIDVTAAAQALRDYAEDGYQLVIAHGTQYGSPLFEIAADFPNTSFAWGTATDTGSELGLRNVFAYEARAEQAGYVQGIMAGLLTESNTIGIVGPVPAGDALLHILGFQQGVAASNPDANVLLAYTGSFGDTAGAAEIARTQIAAGADILTGSAQQVVGAIDAVEAAGGLWFGLQADQTLNWPTTVAATAVFNWQPILGRMVDSILSGSLGMQAYELSFVNGGMKMVFGDVDIPDSVFAAAEEALAGIASGDIVVSRELPQ